MKKYIKFSEWLKIKEGMGSAPYIGSCNKKNADYQVLGACSDQNSEKKNKKIRNGKI